MLRCCYLVTILFILAVSAEKGLSAQSCPSSDENNTDIPQASVLRGTIRIHHGTRPWLVSSWKNQSVALLKSSWHSAATGGLMPSKMDHCSVTVKGVISESVTAYYSRPLNIFNPAITADSNCRLLRPDPDYEKRIIPDSIKSYEVTVFTDVRGNKPLRGAVLAAGRHEEPWRAYAKPFLNRQKDLDLSCRTGFNLISFKSTAGTAELLTPDTARLFVGNEGAPASLTIVCRRDN
jgi:hypothetical protein